MESPRDEVASVITLLTTAVSPDIQRATLQKYFTRDAAFRHPLCRVDSSYNSRESLLGVYQWYRVLSPKIDLTVNHVGEWKCV